MPLEDFSISETGSSRSEQPPSTTSTATTQQQSTVATSLTQLDETDKARNEEDDVFVEDPGPSGIREIQSLMQTHVDGDGEGTAEGEGGLVKTGSKKNVIQVCPTPSLARSV